MKGWEASTYGDAVADVYDTLYAHHDPAAAVETLAALAAAAGAAAAAAGASAGPVLELGIGTGRIALPLAAKGLTVHGIDASEAMVAKLRAKPGGAALHVTFGDFARVDAAPDARFSVVFVAFNTFFALTTQEAQLACFANVARRLEPGGVFVLEVFVPDPTRFTNGQITQTLQVHRDHIVVEASRHDRAAQTIDTQLVMLAESGTRLLPITLRYAYPGELDLMARLAGLRLRERWANFARAPFGSTSPQHVSVYEAVR